jgi:hypothetical protein
MNFNNPLAVKRMKPAQFITHIEYIRESCNLNCSHHYGMNNILLTRAEAERLAGLPVTVSKGDYPTYKW